MGKQVRQLALHPIFVGIGAGSRLPDRRPPWRWCEEHVYVDDSSPMPGKWRSDFSPWVRAVMEDFADNNIKDIAVQCGCGFVDPQRIGKSALRSLSIQPEGVFLQKRIIHVHFVSPFYRTYLVYPVYLIYLVYHVYLVFTIIYLNHHAFPLSLP